MNQSASARVALAMVMAMIAALALTLPAHAQGDSDDPPQSDPQSGSGGADTDADDADTDTDDDADDDEAATIESKLIDAASIPEYYRIRTPSSPAFAILGVSPTQIERPTTPRDFAMSLSNSVQDSADLTIPADIALEFAPYWWFRHGRLTFNDYMKAGFGANILRNLSLSVGTTSRTVPIIDAMGMEIGTSAESRMAFGIRTQLYTGKSAADICAGRVQDKASALALDLLKNTSNAEKKAQRKVMVTGAVFASWQRLLPLVKDLDKATQQRERARKALAGPHDSAESQRRAADAFKGATEAKNEADKALADLLASHKLRAASAAERVKAAEAAVAEQKQRVAAADKSDKSKKKPKDEALQKAKDALARAKAGKRAADKALDTVVAGSKLTPTQVQSELEDAELLAASAREAREKASEKRKEAELSGTYKKRLEQLAELCKDASAARTGWIISVAGASAWLFPEAIFANGRLHTAAGWLTIAHTFNQGTTLAAVVRGAYAEFDSGSSARRLVFDTGGRVIQAYRKFAVSAELVGRATTDDFIGVRAALVGEYMVSKGSWVSLSFGKDFSNDAPIFALANFQWAMGGEARLAE